MVFESGYDSVRVTNMSRHIQTVPYIYIQVAHETPLILLGFDSEGFGVWASDWNLQLGLFNLIGL